MKTLATLFTLAAAGLMAAGAHAQAAKLVPAQSEVGFSVKQLGVPVEGKSLSGSTRAPAAQRPLSTPGASLDAAQASASVSAISSVDTALTSGVTAMRIIE